MFVITAFALLVGALILIQAVGARRAIWYVWWPALMLPTYSYRQWGPMEISLPTVAAIPLLAVLVMPGRMIRQKWAWPDSLMGLFLISVIYSEISSGGRLGSALELVRRWLVPYLLGRMALSRPGHEEEDEMGPAVWILNLGCLAIAAMSIVEAVSHTNVFGMVFNHEFIYQVRYGLRRASGPTPGPIALGMLFVCLLPWALEAGHRARRGAGPGWYRWMPLVAAAGLFSSVSRGPWLAGIIAIGVLLFLQHPRWRSSFLTVAVAAVLLLLVGRQQVADALVALEGDDYGQRETIRIGSETYWYTGTNHRYLQFLAYEDVIRNTSATGRGAEGMLELRKAANRETYMPDLPRNLPMVFYSIDSHYLHLWLERGLVGVSLWSGVMLFAIYYFAITPPGPDQFLGHALAGALVGITLTLATVYSHAPFEPAYLFLAGLAVRWRSRATSIHMDVDETSTSARVETAL